MPHCNSYLPLEILFLIFKVHPKSMFLVNKCFTFAYLRSAYYQMYINGDFVFGQMFNYPEFIHVLTINLKNVNSNWDHLNFIFRNLHFANLQFLTLVGLPYSSHPSIELILECASKSTKLLGLDLFLIPLTTSVKSKIKLLLNLRILRLDELPTDLYDYKSYKTITSLSFECFTDNPDVSYSQPLPFITILKIERGDPLGHNSAFIHFLFPNLSEFKYQQSSVKLDLRNIKLDKLDIYCDAVSEFPNNLQKLTLRTKWGHSNSMWIHKLAILKDLKKCFIQIEYIIGPECRTDFNQIKEIFKFIMDCKFRCQVEIGNASVKIANYDLRSVEYFTVERGIYIYGDSTGLYMALLDYS